MNIVVLNYSGSVGKTVVASHVLAPRIPSADIIAVESTNETGADLGLTVEQMRGEQFGLLFRRLLTCEAAIVDVGATNVEDFLAHMVRYDQSHDEIDYFVLPVIPSGKAQRETLKTIEALVALGVQAPRIRVVFNRVEIDVRDEFAPIFGYARVNQTFQPNPLAAIYRNDVFDLLANRRITISEVLADTTDYRQLLREAKPTDEKEIARYTELIALRALARPVHQQLDSVFAALLS
ncbi:Uncharacterised protein [Bordetella ansorpii]|uniref:Plasmid stability protein StbB n=1 Tax=Bordetella ansorpii TaxID=288768 RepID=A0A157SS66_9BORD|nr:StbB family protein [Bordetella ansorpii]SAI73154.1 Uncharacterised protein [Bordetella ansorpii]